MYYSEINHGAVFVLEALKHTLEYRKRPSQLGEDPSLKAPMVVGKDFDIWNEPIHIGEGGQQLKANEVFVQVLYFSADPYLRGRVKQNNPLAAAATTKSESEIEVKDTESTQDKGS